MKGIGGYFELELAKGEHYHKNALQLNTARNCLEYILKAREYTKVYIPYYTCEVILEPFKKCNTAYEYYPINEDLEPTELLKLGEREAFLYTNYFGLKQSYIEKLALIYGNKLIVDNAQAFFAKPLKGVDTFYSCRKFFGVSDGAYLYTDKHLAIHLEEDVSYSRMQYLLKRIDLGAQEGYGDFQETESSLIGQPIKKMSRLTRSILSSIDYTKIYQERRRNIAYIHECLQNSNLLSVEFTEEDIPLSYPYLNKKEGLKAYLIKQSIYTPTYWPNVMDWSKYNLESKLASSIVPIPVDQRYNRETIDVIVNHIKNYNNE